MAKKDRKIKGIRDMLAKVAAPVIEGIRPEALGEFAKMCGKLPDSRHQSYVEHKLGDIVMIALLAVMSGADEWLKIRIFAKEKAKWLYGFLELPAGIPSHDTIQRVMSQISGDLLYSLTIQFLIVRIEKLSDTAWMLRVMAGEINEEVKAEPHILACDGKTSCGSKRNKTDKDAVKAMHTVSVYSTEYGLCVGESVVDEKTNEIPTVQAMLETFSVKKCIVTWDALNSQFGTVAAVIRGGGDYVAPIKGNHPVLYDELQEYFADGYVQSDLKSEEKRKFCHRVTEDKEQSGVATREYLLSDEVSWINMKKTERLQWKGLKRIGCVTRTLRKKVGKTTVETVETRYFITSVTDIDDFAKAVRGHWGIENKIHCPLDYTFHDDQNTTTVKHGAQNLQTMKRVSLAILTLAQTFFGGVSISNIRYQLALNFEKNIENIFRILNADALSRLLLPRTG
jgi:predicted transposase YbfD/YdcC